MQIFIKMNRYYLPLLLVFPILFTHVYLE